MVLWVAGQETSKTVSFQFRVPKEEESLACLKNPEQALWVEQSEIGEKKSQSRKGFVDPRSTSAFTLGKVGASECCRQRKEVT